MLERRFLRTWAAKLFKDDEKKIFSFARVVGIIIMIVFLLIVVAGMVMLVMPQLYQSVEKLIMSVDSYVNVVLQWANRYLSENPDMESSMGSIITQVLKYLADWLQGSVLTRLDTIIVSVTSGLKNVVMALFNFCIGIIVSVYVLYSKEKFCAQSKKVFFSFMTPKNANGILQAF